MDDEKINKMIKGVGVTSGFVALEVAKNVIRKSKKAAAVSKSVDRDCPSTSPSSKVPLKKVDVEAISKSRTPQKKGKAFSDRVSNSNVSKVDVNLDTKVNSINNGVEFRIIDANRDLQYLTQLCETKTCFNKAEKMKIANIVYKHGTDIYKTLSYPTSIYQKVETVIAKLYERECKRKSVVSEEDMKMRLSFVFLNTNEASFVSPQNCMQIAKKGAEMYPDNPYFHCLLSCAYILMKDYEGGLRHVEQALKKFPNQVELLNTRAVHLCMVLGVTDESIERMVEAHNEFLQALPQDHWRVPESYYSIAAIYKDGVCLPTTEKVKQERYKKMNEFFIRGVQAEKRVHPHFQYRLRNERKLEVKEFLLQTSSDEEPKKIALTSETKGATECVYLSIENNVEADFVVKEGINSKILCEPEKQNCNDCVALVETCGEVEGPIKREDEVVNEKDARDSPENGRVTAPDNKITKEETELLLTLGEPSQLSPKEVVLIKESYLFPDVQTGKIHEEIEAVKVLATSVVAQAIDEATPPPLQGSVHSDFSSLEASAVTQPVSHPEPSELATTDELIFPSEKKTQLPDIDSSKRGVTTDFEHEQGIEPESEIRCGEEIPSFDELMVIYDNMTESDMEDAESELDATHDELVPAPQETIVKNVSKCFDILMEQRKMKARTGVVEKSLVQEETFKAPPTLLLLEVEGMNEPMSPPRKPSVKAIDFPPPPPEVKPVVELMSPLKPSELATIDELTVTSSSETQHSTGATDDLESEGEIKAESEALKISGTALGTQAGDERTPLPFKGSALIDFSSPDAFAVTQPTPPKIPKFGRNNGFTLSQDTTEYREPKVSFRTVRKASGTSKFFNVPRITETPPIIPSATFLSSRHRHIALTSSYNAPKDNSNADNKPGSPPPPETAAVSETVASPHESSTINETSSLTKFDLLYESQIAVLTATSVITRPAADDQLAFSQEAPSKNEPVSPLSEDLASNNAIVKCSEKQIVTEPKPSSTSLKLQSVSESEIVTGSPVLPSEGSEEEIAVSMKVPSFNEPLSLPLSLQQVQLQNERDTNFLVMIPLYCIAMYLFAQGYPMSAIFMILYVSFILLRDN
ncbi:unnamed protein product [Orchesella dallaii]|uniref:Uncharacterized protein n=1 Tax=Orchesella dallaii TaxID=48710 RepID=A0ABP1RBV5_9HEXA